MRAFKQQYTRLTCHVQRSLIEWVQSFDTYPPSRVNPVHSKRSPKKKNKIVAKFCVSRREICRPITKSMTVNSMREELSFTCDFDEVILSSLNEKYKALKSSS